MAAYQKAVSASYESATKRIRESLDLLAHAGEPLDAWQSDLLARALAFLQVGNYALAIDAAFRVCRPQLFRSSKAVIALSGAPTVTIAEVRDQLERAVAERGA